MEDIKGNLSGVLMSLSTGKQDSKRLCSADKIMQDNICLPPFLVTVTTNLLISIPATENT